MKACFFVLIFCAVINASGYAAAQVMNTQTVVQAPPPGTVIQGAPPGTVMLARPAPVVVAAQPYCRPFKQTFTIEHTTQIGRGTACLQSDGSWQITSLAGGVSYFTRGNGVFVMAPQPFVEEKIILGDRHHFHQ